MADAPPKKGYITEQLVCEPPNITVECGATNPTVGNTSADQLAIANDALDAIDKITNTANFWLTTMSVAITVISLFSIGLIIFLLKGSAFKRVDKGLTKYLESNQFKDSLATTVANAVDNHRENTQGAGTEPGQAGPDTDLNLGGDFPDIPQEGG